MSNWETKGEIGLEKDTLNYREIVMWERTEKARHKVMTDLVYDRLEEKTEKCNGILEDAEEAKNAGWWRKWK